MKENKIFNIAQGAVIAALYITINYLQEVLFPTTTSMPVQFRLAEILTITAVFSSSAIYGLAIGCLISNIINVGVLPLDMLFGTVASFLAAYLIYQLRGIKWFTLPVLASLMPVLCNGIIIGAELELFYIQGQFHLESFLIQAGLVAIGEFVVCVLLGLPFYKLIEKLNIFDKNKTGKT